MEYYFKLFVKFSITFFAPAAWFVVLYVLFGKAKKAIFSVVIVLSFLVFAVLAGKEVFDVGGVPLNNEIITYLMGTILGLAAAALVFLPRRGMIGSWLDDNFSQGSARYTGLHLRRLLQAAVSLEDEGEEFYRNLSLGDYDDSVKELCAGLADKEKKHKEIIEEMLGHWLPVNPREESAQEFKKAARGLGLFVKKPKPGSSQEIMLDYAIEQEKKSIELYQSFEKLFPQEWKRQYVERLVHEEEIHLNDLAELRDKKN